MNLKSKHQFVKSSFITLLAAGLLAISDAQAQSPGVRGNQDKPDNCGNCEGNNGKGLGNQGTRNSVPIDGGASILLAAGAVYGMKKLRDFRNEKNQGQ